jgi:hypothetical protein
MKHAHHICHVATLPLAEITVEGGRITEHHTHIRHLASLPLAETTVEGGCTIEHPSYLLRCQKEKYTEK